MLYISYPISNVDMVTLLSLFHVKDKQTSLSYFCAVQNLQVNCACCCILKNACQSSQEKEECIDPYLL